MESLIQSETGTQLHVYLIVQFASDQPDSDRLNIKF
jgi:hypothetical protein